MKDSEPADQPPQLQEAEPVQFLDSKNIMKRIFYQNNEATVEKQYFDEARKVKINLQQMEFKSISLNEEKMVISLDLIEMHDQDTDKKRTMIAMQVLPSGKHLPQQKAGRLTEIEQMCKPQNQSFEDAYSKLNERFINEIIDQESERQRGREQEGDRCPTCGSTKSTGEARGPEQDEQNFLLIGESSFQVASVASNPVPSAPQPVKEQERPVLQSQTPTNIEISTTSRNLKPNLSREQASSRYTLRSDSRNLRHTMPTESSRSRSKNKSTDLGCSKKQPHLKVTKAQHSCPEVAAPARPSQVSQRNPTQVVQHLYNDFFIRTQKQSLQEQQASRPDERRLKQSRSNILKQNTVLATGLKNKIQKALKRMNVDSGKDTSRLAPDQQELLLALLNYTNDQETAELADQLCSLVRDSQQGVTVGNMTTTLLAIENIFIPRMVANMAEFESQQVQMKDFGLVVNGVYFLSSEQEIKKMASHFSLLVQTRLNEEAKKVREKEEAFTKIKFEPTINKKSQKIASLRLEGLIQKPSTKSQGSSVESQRASQRAGLRYEDFLINRGKEFKEKLQEKAKELQQEQL